jgi:hypothetical protein
MPFTIERISDKILDEIIDTAKYISKSFIYLGIDLLYNKDKIYQGLIKY